MTTASVDRETVLARPTARRVLGVLASTPQPMSAQQIADALDLHHTGVRVQLNALVAGGLVISQASPPSGRGRPTVRYAAAPDPGEQIAAGHRELVRLLMRLVSRMGLNRSEMEAFGRSQGHSMTAADAGPDELMLSLSRLGFDPREIDGDDPRDIVLGYCPFADGVEAPDGELICALHLGLARGVVEASGAPLEIVELLEEEPHLAGCRLRLAALSAL